MIGCKLLILYSGGLDSFLMYRYAVGTGLYAPEDIKCVYYDIGQDYAEKEIAVLPDFVEIRKVDWLNIVDNTGGKEGNESGSIFIPGRNMVLATLAASQYLPDVIWLGALAGEGHEGATDKNYKFKKQITELMSYVLSPFKGEVKLSYPFAEMNMGKRDIVSYAIMNGLATAEEILATSSCMSGVEEKCGKCVVCFRRWGIFKQIGLKEEYTTHPLHHPENWEIVRAMTDPNNAHYDDKRKEEILPALLMQYVEEGGKGIHFKDWLMGEKADE